MSDKTKVIEHLFDKYWDEASKALTKDVMTLDDVKEAIRQCNEEDGLSRSDRNPANFLKDVVRSRNASNIWPKRLADLGFTGEQRTGSGDSFAFVPYVAGQAEPFPDLYRPTDKTRRVRLQSVSMSLASKSLGRSDEAWLIQTAVNLRVIEHHLATESDIEVQEVDHLQMNVKLRTTEIDAIYLASVVEDRASKQALITCEAKNQSERILVGQVTSQARAAFETTAVGMVIPIAIRSIMNEGIQLIEFKKILRKDAEELKVVEYCRDVVYVLVPHVEGISKKERRRTAAVKKVDAINS